MAAVSPTSRASFAKLQRTRSGGSANSIRDARPAGECSLFHGVIERQERQRDGERERERERATDFPGDPRGRELAKRSPPSRDFIVIDESRKAEDGILESMTQRQYSYRAFLLFLLFE